MATKLNKLKIQLKKLKTKNFVWIWFWEVLRFFSTWSFGSFQTFLLKGDLNKCCEKCVYAKKRQHIDFSENNEFWHTNENFGTQENHHFQSKKSIIYRPEEPFRWIPLDHSSKFLAAGEIIFFCFWLFGCLRRNVWDEPLIE